MAKKEPYVRAQFGDRWDRFREKTSRWSTAKKAKTSATRMCSSCGSRCQYDFNGSTYKCSSCKE